MLRSYATKRGKRHLNRRFLEDLAPDFCWCSGKDLFLMMECLHEDVPEDSFKVTLHKMMREGIFITKPNPYHESQRGLTGRLYLKIKCFSK